MLKKNKDLGKKKTSSETVSQIFQAPSEDWKPRNFGNTTLSSCSVVETSHFLLWKVGAATVFCVCGVFFFWSRAGLFLSLDGCCHLTSLSGTVALLIAQRH